MTKLQSNIKEFMVKAGQVIRIKPSYLTPEESVLRIKLIMEELLELSFILGVEISFNNETLQLSELKFIYDKYAILHIEQNEPENYYLIQAADAIADLNYVVNGTAVALGIDMEPVDNEVHRSNMSKFIDGYRREDGKWVKGPAYTPADIKSIIEIQKNYEMIG